MSGEWWFAWRPVRLVDGRWMWLRFVHRQTRWNGRMGKHCKIWWEYSR